MDENKAIEAEKTVQQDSSSARSDGQSPDANVTDIGDETSDAQDDPKASVNKPTGRAVLDGKYDIFFSEPLKHFDRGPSKAYAASVVGETNKLYFALVCDPDYAPRRTLIEKYTSIINPAMANLLQAGVVYWPPANAQRYVFIYRNNLGQPLAPDPEHAGLGWRSDKVIKAFVKPMIAVLLDMRDKGVSHRGINPANIFDGGAGKDIEKVILGDCLSVPPGMAQPAVFESLDRALADPVARGVGAIEDDLYAMGVTITILMRHSDPLAKMSDYDVVKSKVEIGSYATLTGGERFAGPIMELLRGLLYDTPAQRLSLEEITSWLEGQRLLPRQPVMAKKANRPLPFNGKNYVRPFMLANNLAENAPAAIQLMESGDIELWISRSLEDAQMEERYDKALKGPGNQAKGAGTGYWDRALSYITMVLSPESPLRYKGQSMCIDGISYGMAHAAVTGGDVQAYHELINHQMVSRWLSLQKEGVYDISQIYKKFDNARKSVNQPNVGHGIERALYLISEETHCLSPYLSGYYVTTMAQLMDALEDISQKEDRPDLPIDRHIAAFISVRDSKSIDSFLLELNSRDYFKKILANLRILAMIQKRLKLKEYPGVSAWLSQGMEPVYERYHDRKMRENIQKKVQAVTKKGNLSELSSIVDNDAIWKQDLNNFKSAMNEYRMLRAEEQKIKMQLKNPSRFSKDLGQEMAAIASGILSGIIILAFAFIYLLR